MQYTLLGMLLLGIEVAEPQSHTTPTPALNNEPFHVEQPAKPIVSIEHWLNQNAVKWAGQWQVIDSPETQAKIGIEASWLYSPITPLSDKFQQPTVYELYYQHQWFERYSIKPQLKYIQPRQKALGSKEAVIFTLSTEISF